MEKVLSDLDESTIDIGLGNIGKLVKSLFHLAPSGIEITDENYDCPTIYRSNSGCSGKTKVCGFNKI